MHGSVVPITMSDFDGSGRFEGMASVYGVPIDRLFGQVVMEPGMFGESIANQGSKNIRMLWQHDTDKPIGVYLNVFETQNGVAVEGKLLVEEIQQAREAYALLKAKAIGGLSVGFGISESYTDNKTGIVHYTKGDLWEVSLVTFPANSQATIDRVHSKTLEQFQTIRDLEKFLRDAGLSRTAAKAIASHGFEGIRQRDVEQIDQEILEALRNHNQEMRKAIPWKN